MSNSPFADFMDFIERKHGEDTWVSVYKQINTVDQSQDGGFYSALIAKDRVGSAMATPSWDMTKGYDAPGLACGTEDGEEVVRYVAFDDEGLQRLVICREFEGGKADYRELIEEFRLFHNLYQEGGSSKLFAIDEAGDSVEVANFSETEVKIRRGYLRSFMAAKQMDLLLYFDVFFHHSNGQSLEFELEAENIRATIYTGSGFVKDYKSALRVFGKKLMRCGPVEQSGVFPFKVKQFEEFTIGGDSDNPEKSTCDPDQLANNIGANPECPHYLTPVFFRKDVMQKYYGSSDYEISDGWLSRHGSWGLRLDNNSADHVSVFLGDLGRDLPFREQQYWKSFNLFPEDRTISNTYHQRSFVGAFFDPESPEHQFKYAFSEIQEAFEKHYGWTLFLQLNPKDLHFFDAIRSMLGNQQSEFDSMILGLVKSTIDSLNVKALREQLGTDESKSIVLLESFLTKLNVKEVEQIAQFLKGVQAVRSSGVAHRKGTEYEKVIKRLSLDENNYQAEFDEILRQFVWALGIIKNAIGSIRRTDDEVAVTA